MTNANNSTKIYDKVVKCVQSTVDALLQYVRAINTKLLVSLIDIEYQQAAATENMNEAIYQLLDYVAM